MRGSQRLPKARSSESNLPTRSSLSLRRRTSETHDDTTPAIKASYDDLKKPENRRLLRQQVSGTFPETAARKASYESIALSQGSARDSSTRRRSRNLDVGTNISSRASFDTVNDFTNAPRLSIVAENDRPQPLDVEQAISLLQELRKSASPQELVALHRALLPTKDTDSFIGPMPTDESNMLSASSNYSRRSANLTPGLATRGGLDEDVLRKLDHTPRNEPSKRNSVQRQTATTHESSTLLGSLAALDLAEDVPKPWTNRPVTPSEAAYSHTGAYQPGTLRITNGAASPDPSISTARDPDAATVEGSVSDAAFSTTFEEPILEFTPTRASIDVVQGCPVEDSPTVSNHNLISDTDLQQKQKKRANRISGLSLNGSRDSLTPSKSLTVQTRTSRHSFDRDSVSSLSDVPTPRRNRRVSHKTSQTSQEYVSDCELSSSSFDDKFVNAMMNFASRLSTVYDSDADDNADDDHGTPQAALEKLTGTPARPEQIVITASPVEMAATSVREPALAQPSKDDRPAQPKKVDSGYASDSSIRRARVRALQKATRLRIQQRADAANRPQPRDFATYGDEQDESPSIAAKQSLYTWHEALKALDSRPASVAAESAQISELPDNTSQLHLHNVRRATLPITVMSEISQSSSGTMPTVDSTQSSPGEPKHTLRTSKSQKKLQKKMPAAVKEQRRSELQKLKDAHASAASMSHLRVDISHSDVSPLASPTGGLPNAAARRGYSLDDELYRSQQLQSSLASESNETAPRQSLDAAATETRKRTFSLHRSKSRDRTKIDSTDDLPLTTSGISSKRSSFDIMGKLRFGSSERAADAKRAESPGDEMMPAFTDFNSVARTLGSSSYDISTNQFQRQTSMARGAALHQLQSPYMISTGLGRPKQLTGMNEEAAVELARAKSRDFAGHDMIPMYDRPRMATPKRDRTGASVSLSSPSISVEERFPGWQGKDSPDNGSPQIPSSQRYSLYAESIPPMPELPADVEIKAFKADALVAKKLKDKDSARSTPATSARNSAEPPSQPVRGESSTAVAQIKPEEETFMVEQKTLQLLHPVERAAVKQQPAISVQVREMNGSSSDLSTAAGAETGAVEERVTEVEDENEDGDADDESVTSPTHEARHPGWVGWEQQAKLWRQRRESIGASLGKDPEEQSVITADSPPMSRQVSLAQLQDTTAKLPSISVQRYITPLGSQNAAAAANANTSPATPASPAVQHANLYRTLITDGDDKENRPAKKEEVLRTSSTVSTSTTTVTTTTGARSFVTVKTWSPYDPRPAKPDIPRTDSAHSAKSYHLTTVTSTATSVSRNAATQAKAYTPYSPSHEASALHSRQQSQHMNNQNSTHQPTATPRTLPTSHSNTSHEALSDRFGGGLSYNWRRSVGFVGSAGTTATSPTTSIPMGKKKSLHTSSQWGLDLSDVPVFVTRG